MADSPWTVPGTKRRRTTTTPAPRKRSRVSHDVSTSGANTSGRRNIAQQTLTQIDFVKSSPFGYENDLDQEKLEPIGPADVPPQVQSARRRLKKRDSTLTQMNFFSPLAAETTKIFDDRMISTPQIEAGSGQKWLPVPAFDGTQDDQPQQHGDMPGSRPRLEKLARTTRAVKQAEKFKGSEDQEDYQEHRHRKRRKMHIDENVQGLVNRRRSSRLAAAAVDEHLPHSGREGPVPQPASERSRTHIDSAGRPVLEVQDSIDFTEPSLRPTSRLATTMAQPVTPTKDRDRIPSSQTPESLSCTRKTRSNERQPLAELNTNVQRTPSKVAKMSKVPSKPPTKQSPRRKICILKVPARALLPRTNCVEDSQQDIWSLQATSSTRRDNRSPQAQEKQSQKTTSYDKSPTTMQLPKSKSDGPSIQESTPRTDVDTQKSLLDVSAILGFPVDITSSTVDRGTAGLVHTSTSALGLRQDTRESAKGAHDEVSTDQEPINMIPELEQVSSDELSDFGSPIANDTQFAKSLRNQVSSPVPTSDDDKHRPKTAPAKGNRASPPPRDLAQASMAMSPPRRSPLRAPRLVGTSPRRTVQRHVAGSSTGSLPLLVTKSLSPKKAADRVRITKVPLNDTSEHQRLPSSSSPVLPQVPTQKSVHPASIPHPSQVSTQAPSTQGLQFPVSSAPNSFPVLREAEIERITIKDSSSVPARLSQFRMHVQDGELDAGDEIPLIDDFEDDEDLDLDPFTWRAPSPSKNIRRQARTAQQSSEEEDTTQTPTQKLRTRRLLLYRETDEQSSPIITNATTRSQRDAKLEVIAIPSSSQPTYDQPEGDGLTPRPAKDFADDQHKHQSPPLSSLPSSIFSPSPPRQLQRKYSPIPGFNNDTQSDFTQDGHVTAAYIHRMREEGLLPKSYVPKPFKPKNWSKSMRSERQKERARAGKNR